MNKATNFKTITYKNQTVTAIEWDKQDWTARVNGMEVEGESATAVEAIQTAKGLLDKCNGLEAFWR